MNKDVIYIDIEDDITGIIGKVKQSSSKIIALVPPKRAGVLQSVVNLKLLQRAAQTVDKRLVIITSDTSLTALAAGLKIPIAKNLQSRPEIPVSPILASSQEDDVINGKELPIGEVATSLSTPKAASAAEDISDKIDFADATATTPKKPVGDVKKVMPAMPFKKDGGRKGFKIPDFEDFRKRIFLFGGLGVLLISFLIWAIFFAPRATITITARTTAVNVDKALTLKPSQPSSDTQKLLLKPNVQQVKKAVAVEFEASGTKDIGNKASGTITVSNGFDSDPITIPSGTTFTSTSGPTFTSNGAVTIPGAKVSGGGIKPGTAEVTVTATAVGPESNLESQNYSVQGFNSVGATGGKMSGGTKETVKVVSQEDIDKAKQQLSSQNSNDIKAELKKQFKTDQHFIIEESFIADQAQPTSSPAVGEQASRAKLTQETTFTLVGLSKDDVRTILSDVVKEALKTKPDQQQYSLGDKNIEFQLFQKLPDGSFTTTLATTAYIGPKIDTKALATQLTGKRHGEIQAVVQEIEGVNKVDIAFSPFWVTTAPSTDKIDIKFSVANDK